MKQYNLLRQHLPEKERKTLNYVQRPGNVLIIVNCQPCPEYPADLPPLQSESGKLIEFMSIRLLRHQIGIYGIFGEVIAYSVLVDVYVT